RVVFVKGDLPPRIEFNFAEGPVRIVCADQPARRIVAKYRRHAPFNQLLFVIEHGTRIKEGLVLLNRVAFVIENRSTASHPANSRRSVAPDDVVQRISNQRTQRISLWGKTRFGL